jgi:hypothetical protein
MAGTNFVAVPQTAPGDTADLLVSMTAPAAPGAHTGQWKMRNVRDSYFGGAVTVAINVVDTSAPPQPPTEQPQAPPAQTGCSGTPNIASFSASPTSFGISGGQTTLTWGEVTNADSVEIDNGIGGVATPGNTTVQVNQNTTFTLTAHCGSNSKTAQATVTVLTLHIVQPVVPFLIFKVTGASASKNAYVCDSHGMATGKFNGTISANGAGDITYKWEDSNAPSGGTVQSLHFTSAATLGVPQYTRSIADTGQMYIHVLTPNSLLSNKVTYGCPYSP